MSDTVEMMYPCQESRDADTPTPLEFAFELLGVNHRDAQEELVSIVDQGEARTYFSQGWSAGIECTLDESQLPSRRSMTKEARAWLIGFVAGQFALSNGYPTPFCIFPEHQH